MPLNYTHWTFCETTFNQASTISLPIEAKDRVDFLQFLHWPLSAGSKTEQIHTDTCVQMANLTAELNIFTA